MCLNSHCRIYFWPQILIPEIFLRQNSIYILNIYLCFALHNISYSYNVLRSLGTISEVNYIKSCLSTDHSKMLNIVFSRCTMLCYNAKLTIEFMYFYSKFGLCQLVWSSATSFRIMLVFSDLISEQSTGNLNTAKSFLYWMKSLSFTLFFRC